RDTVDWRELALACGYFDQAHFIHEFKEFSSLTPGQYLGLRTAHPRHVRLPA
ncbi:MAG: AraC family transcriptional regulator, partial [Blastocatellia bacterium]